MSFELGMDRDNARREVTDSLELVCHECMIGSLVSKLFHTTDE